jgi:hypothetical protein
MRTTRRARCQNECFVAAVIMWFPLCSPSTVRIHHRNSIDSNTVHFIPNKYTALSNLNIFIQFNVSGRNQILLSCHSMSWLRRLFIQIPFLSFYIIYRHVRVCIGFATRSTFLSQRGNAYCHLCLENRTYLCVIFAGFTHLKKRARSSCPAERGTRPW